MACDNRLDGARRSDSGPVHCVNRPLAAFVLSGASVARQRPRTPKVQTPSGSPPEVRSALITANLLD